MSTSKTGKHGHAKVHLVAIDIFTGKKLEDISPSTHNMDVPNVRRTEYQLLDIADGFLSLMDSDGNAKDDVKVPDNELGNDIQKAFDDGKDLMVTIVAAMDEEQAISWYVGGDPHFSPLRNADSSQEGGPRREVDDDEGTIGVTAAHLSSPRCIHLINLVWVCVA